MLLASVRSINGKTIRLTAERWRHIVDNHSEIGGMMNDVLRAIRQPDRILRGKHHEFFAVRLPDKRSKINRHLIVVYRETPADGFIITAFITSKIAKFIRTYKKL